MNLNWDNVLRVTVPLGTLVLGKYLEHWTTARPKVISYMGHASSFTLRGETSGIVNTHAIVIKNTGRKAANNVRIGHRILPECYQLFPAIPHKTLKESDTISEIVLDTLVPGEQITISYLYFPPLVFTEVHAYIKSDEGFARILNVLPSPQLPKWSIAMIWALTLVSISTLTYLGIEAIGTIVTIR